MLNILADHSAVCPFINAELFLKKFNAWGQCGECTVILSFFSLCVLRRTEERMATLTQKTKKSAPISGGTMSYRIPKNDATEPPAPPYMRRFVKSLARGLRTSLVKATPTEIR